MIGYLGLGSNLGNRQENLQKAIACLDPGAVSSVYETKPWGYSSENAFLNQVIRIDTALSPSELLQQIRQIEKSLGREEKTKDGYEDRLIDIDILLYDDLILETEELTIPHPHLHERLFVLEGLNEIAPDLIHPRLNQSIAELYAKLT